MVGFFSASTMAGMKQVQANSLIETGYLRRVTLADDGAGGGTEVVTILGPYPCRVGVSRLQRGELLQAGQLRGGLPWTVTFEAGVDARLADDINVNGTVSGTNFVGGRNFEILALYSPTTYSTATVCLCAEK